MIVDFAHRAALRNRTILVLIPRVKLATLIASKLSHRGVSSVAVTGSTPKKERVKSLNAIRTGAVRVMISTQLADEGLDVPILDVLILANPGKAAGRSIQRIGRIMRLHDLKKKPVAIDFVDRGPFRRHWEDRCFAYIENVGVHPSNPVSYKEATTIIKEVL